MTGTASHEPVLSGHAMPEVPAGPPIFTVFTATFNRAHTLPRVYDSLTRQTLRSFEWVVVDDGSTDGTRDLVEGWAARAAFPVRYLYQPNAGKPAALNRGVQVARGELFLNLDSDDTCVPTALERLLHHWHAIPEAERSQFTGVTGLCLDERGKLHGRPYRRAVMDSDSLEMHFRYRDRWERWGFHRTDVLRAFPFPVDPDARFVSESVVWFRIARRYRTRFVNEALRLYHVAERRPDQLTALSRGAMRGRLPYHVMVLTELREWWRPAPLEFVRSALAYSRYSYTLGVGRTEQLRSVHGPMRVLVALAQPAGWLVSRLDRRLP